MLGVFGGLRAGEIVRLHWRDVDLDGRLLTVRVAKSRRCRYVPIHEQLARTLEANQVRQGSVCGIREDDEGVRQLAKAAKSLAASCGLRGRVKGMHILRHTFAALLVQAGESLYRVQRWLGHSTPVTTQRYAHLAPDQRGMIDAI